MRWPDEGRFLVDVAARRARWPGGGLDVDRLELLAERHGMIPTLAHAIAGDDAVPGPARERFAQAASRIAVGNLARSAELLELLELLRDRGLRALAVKGPALAIDLYDDVGRRRFVDLDILVAPGDVPVAAYALEAAGYEPEIPLARDPLDHLIRHDHECSFAGPNGPVELQWGALPPFFGVRWPVGPALERAKDLDLGGSRVPTLADADLLLYLSLHGAKHGWERLSWLEDLDTLSRRGAAWEHLRDRAEEAHVLRMVRVGPWLARRALAVGWSEDAIRALGPDPVAHAIAERCADRWFRDDEPAAHEPHRTLDLDHLRMRERWRDRAMHVARATFTPTDRDAPGPGRAPTVRRRLARLAGGALRAG